MKKSILIYIALISSYLYAQVNTFDSLALVQFFNETNGTNWTNNTGWLDTNVSLWYGVVVDSDRVVEIHLPNNNLSGTIYSLSDLPYLRVIDLPNNNITGGLPAGKELKYLKTINLQNNALNINNLNYALMFYPALTYLNIAQNQLTDTLFVINDSLQTLIANNNQFSYFITNAYNLQILDLENNNLSSIPDSIFKLTKLISLNLANNSIKTVPSAIANLSLLKKLKLNNNSISSIKGIWFLDSLNYLDLSNNQISQQFFLDSISFLRKLDTLDLSNNNLYDSLSNFISILSNIKYLDLSENHLTGDIQKLSTLTELKYLDISVNNFYGTIDTSFLKFPNIQHLNLSSNNLDGTIPPQIFTNQITYLNLSNNNLSGTIPTNLNQAINLTTLELANCNLNGQIPSTIGDLLKLQKLNLSHNNLSGEIPITLGQCTNLEYLDLSYNQLSGPVPNSFINLTNLKALNLRHNKLNALTNLNLPNLQYLYLQYNYFDFADFDALNLNWTNLKESSIIPQKRLPITDTIINDTITLYAQIFGANTVYSWYNDTVFIKSTTQNWLKIDTATKGIFYVVATNPTYDSLTIYSNPFSNSIPLKNGIPLPEYNTLKNIYQNTNGDNWRDNTNWLSDENVADWLGIKLYGIHVAYINLKNNNLTGYISSLDSLPFLSFLDLSFNNLDSIAPLNNLRYLKNLYIQNNNIKTLPQIPTQLQTLNCSNNKLSFKELEQIVPNTPTYNDTTPLYPNLQITYSPQKKSGQYKFIAGKIGDTIKLYANVEGNFNHYQWKVITNSDTIPITSDTSVLLLIKIYPFGKYFCEVTNEKVPNLIITTEYTEIEPIAEVIFYVYDTLGNPQDSALITLSGYGNKYTLNGGTTKFDSVKLGDYGFTVYKPGYYFYSGTITITDNTEQTIYLTPITLTIKVFDKNFPVQNATVILNNSQEKTTDITGTAVFYGVKNGLYTLKITASPYKTLYDTILIRGFNLTKNYTLSFSNLDLIQFYPNPTTNYVTIFTIDELKDIEIRIYSLTGKLYFYKKVPTLRQLTIPLNLPQGIYIIDIRNQTYRKVGRLLIW